MTRIVCLDAGHGGPDTGACANGLIERDLNLGLVRMLKSRIESWSSAWQVVLTRERDDEHVPPGMRASRARGAALVISIHHNAYATPAARGLEVYHWPTSPIAAAVCAQIQRAAPAELQKSPVRSVLSAFSTPGAQAVCGWYTEPVALVECGYLTNEHDSAALQLDRIREGLCAAVVSGLWVAGL